MYNNLVVYGSLMDKNELLNENINIDDIDLVKVYGYKRIFNQEPSNRMVQSVNRAVLNVLEDGDSWINGIVLKNVSDELFAILDKREKGYERYNMYEKKVVTYGGETLTNCCIYLGNIVKLSFEILPNLEYLDICKNAAKTHGEEFYNDFLETTFKNSQEFGIEPI
jgi:cation transport regulator ChaC